MKTKHLLTGLVLPALFAACTAEEIESSKGVMTQEDLSARPSVGNVVLNFGNADSRAELGEGAFNSISFTADEDAIGARIIDNYAAAGVKDAYGERVAWYDYKITPNFASSNYQYVYNGEGWKTSALMVEGNYMFYYPYNAKNVARAALEIITPTHQIVKPNEKDGERNAIAELYAGENPAFVGYKFIDAEEQGLVQDVDMQHVFAYPQITLVNDFTVRSGRTDVETDLVITKIVLSSNKIYEKYVVNHTAFQKKLTPEFTYLVKKTDKKEEPIIVAGVWTEAETLLKEATIETIAEHKGKKAEITVEFEDGLELAYGEEYSFNVVLPALDYAAGDLTMQVYTEDDMMIGTTSGTPKSFSIEKDMTFAPGKRYATQEYNFPAKGTPSPKKSAGSMATYELGGKNLELIDAVAPVAVINTIEEFEAYLESIDENVEVLAEIEKINDRKATENNFILAPELDKDGKETGYANLVIDDAFLALLDEYNYAGKISFESKMKVVGAEEAPNADKEIEAFTLGNKDYKMEFKSEVEITEGYVTVNKSTIANKLTVAAGVLTIEDANINAVNVIGGEAIVTNEEFKTYVITAANKVVNNVVVSTGKVTLNYNGETAAPAVDGGNLVIGKNVTINATPAWTKGNVENNGKITANVELPEYVALTNNGKVSGTLNNDGTVYANADMTVAKNTGLIKLGDALVEVTVTDATAEGEIDNTDGGKIVYNGSNQDIYAILTSLVNGGEPEDGEKLSAKYDTYSKVNKFILKGAWTVTDANAKLAETDVNNQPISRIIEFANGSSLKIASGAKLTLNAGVIVAADVNWSGRTEDASTLDLTTCSITFEKNDDTNKFYNVTVKDLKVLGMNPQEELLKQVAAQGGIVSLTGNVDLVEGLNFVKDATVNLNGKNVGLALNVTNTYGSVFKSTKGTLTINGEGTVDGGTDDNGNGSYRNAVCAEGGNVIINGGNYTINQGANALIYAKKGTITINSGKFSAVNKRGTEPGTADAYCLLNCLDANYDIYFANIVVKGGTFKNFNPACNYAEGAGTNFVAENYKVTVKNMVTGLDNTNDIESVSGKKFSAIAFDGGWSQAREYTVK